MNTENKYYDAGSCIDEEVTTLEPISRATSPSSSLSWIPHAMKMTEIVSNNPATKNHISANDKVLDMKLQDIHNDPHMSYAQKRDEYDKALDFHEIHVKEANQLGFLSVIDSIQSVSWLISIVDGIYNIYDALSRK